MAARKKSVRKKSAQKVVRMDTIRERYADYDKRATELVKRLEELIQEMNQTAFQLAAAKPWKEWSDAQPNGSRVCIYDDMLYDTGDDGVNAALLARDSLIEALNMLTNKGNKEE
ncbi:MAG: hypothetical protein KBA61_06595 [Spirochaetes bacterium]|nr:hypothetical protein [Spirochaetota bacterium]